MPDEVGQRLGTKISTNTGITVSLLITVIAAAVWISNALSAAKYETMLLRIEVNGQFTAMQSKLDATSYDRWSATDMRRWIADMQTSNPSVKFVHPVTK